MCSPWGPSLTLITLLGLSQLCVEVHSAPSGSSQFLRQLKRGQAARDDSFLKEDPFGERCPRHLPSSHEPARQAARRGHHKGCGIPRSLRAALPATVPFANDLSLEIPSPPQRGGSPRLAGAPRVFRPLFTSLTGSPSPEGRLKGEAAGES